MKKTYPSRPVVILDIGRVISVVIDHIQTLCEDDGVPVSEYGVYHIVDYFMAKSIISFLGAMGITVISPLEESMCYITEKRRRIADIVFYEYRDLVYSVLKSHPFTAINGGWIRVTSTGNLCVVVLGADDV